MKTDKRDARILAEACKLGAYRPAHRTSDAKRHMRAQLAVREALVRTRTRSIALVSALVRREGLRIADGKAESFVKRVEALALPGRLMAEVAPLLSLMLHLNEQSVFLDGVLDRGRPAASSPLCVRCRWARFRRIAATRSTSRAGPWRACFS